jgi:hypothetical protein
MVRQRLHLPGILAVLSLAAGACLPRGEPPAGHQILADETASLLQLIPSGSDGMRQVLFFRPSQRQDPDLVDLWALTLDPNDQPSPERLLVSGIASGLELSYKPAAGSSGFPVDAHGRVYVFTDEGDDLFRVDAATGDRMDVGPDQYAILSPSGQRILTRAASGPYTLFEADDRTITLDGSQGQFFGETLFYLSPDCNLMRLVAGGAPEQVASGISSYYLLRGTVMYVQHLGLGMCGATDYLGPPSGPQALLDLVTLQEMPLPAGLQVTPGNLSSDGRWMISYHFDQTTFQSQQVIVDLTTGSTEPLDPNIGYGMWRPGHDELWLVAMDASKPGLAGASLNIKTPGQPPVTVPGVYPSGFNEDGRYWFSRGAPPDQLLASDLVGDADDPTGPRYHAVPEGSGLGLAQTLADGRLMVESYTSVDTFRSDDYLIVDPRNGAMSTLGLRGYLSALGKDRLVGIFDYVFERGDLTAVDFATGRRTILAAEDAMAAIVEGNTSDSAQLPPGARVVYQFRARFESPWSGLWLTTVP